MSFSLANHFILKVRRIVVQDFLAACNIRLSLGREVCSHRGAYLLFPTVGFIPFPLGYQEPSAQAASVMFIWVQQIG